MNQFKNLNQKNIVSEIIKLKKELILYKIKKATKQDIKPHIIKNIKHQIAQMLTLEKNINKLH